MTATIRDHLRVKNPHVLIKAGTGVGKSTEFIYQLYKSLLNYTIICAQLTIYNTTALAAFLSRKPGMAFGETLGISTGGIKVEPSSQHCVIYATIGSVLSKFLYPALHDPRMDLSHLLIVIDEAHSNSTD